LSLKPPLPPFYLQTQKWNICQKILKDCEGVIL
jgi:hypothetical protein